MSSVGPVLRNDMWPHWCSLSVHLPVGLSISLYTCSSLSLPVNQLVCLSCLLLDCLSICLLVYLPACLSVALPPFTLIHCYCSYSSLKPNTCFLLPLIHRSIHPAIIYFNHLIYWKVLCNSWHGSSKPCTIRHHHDFCF